MLDSIIHDNPVPIPNPSKRTVGKAELNVRHAFRRLNPTEPDHISKFFDALSQGVPEGGKTALDSALGDKDGLATNLMAVLHDNGDHNVRISGEPNARQIRNNFDLFLTNKNHALTRSLNWDEHVRMGSTETARRNILDVVLSAVVTSDNPAALDALFGEDGDIANIPDIALIHRIFKGTGSNAESTIIPADELTSLFTRNAPLFEKAITESADTSYVYKLIRMYGKAKRLEPNSALAAKSPQMEKAVKARLEKTAAAQKEHRYSSIPDGSPTEKLLLESLLAVTAPQHAEDVDLATVEPPTGFLNQKKENEGIMALMRDPNRSRDAEIWIQDNLARRVTASLKNSAATDTLDVFLWTTRQDDCIRALSSANITTPKSPDDLPQYFQQILRGHRFLKIAAQKSDILADALNKIGVTQTRLDTSIQFDHVTYATDQQLEDEATHLVDNIAAIQIS